MTRLPRFIQLAGALAALAVGLVTTGASQPDEAGTKVYGAPLRVCADPNNLPFSNRAGEGFENKLAEMVATALGRTVAYTWWPQRRGFLRNTLEAGECDVVMGVPKLDAIETTRPYYRSGYVFVTRADATAHPASIEAPELRRLRVGVQLIGDDGANTPPAEALGRQQIVDNVVGYLVYGDYRQEAPPRRIVDAVADGEIDVAAAWGPMAGYFAKHASVPLQVTPIEDTADFLPLVFQFPISMGVRQGDTDLRERLDAFIGSHQSEIDDLLKSYGVPLV